jgi:hypothetical protein
LEATCITFDCFSGWRPVAVVTNATIAYKWLQLNMKFKTASNTVDVFLGGGQIKLAAMLQVLTTASNYSMGVGCISRRRPDPLLATLQ